MSWAEDNGIDAYDAEDLLRESGRRRREEEGKSGHHRDRRGKVMKLSDMTAEHLKNTIAYFHRLDTSALQKELNSRK